MIGTSFGVFALELLTADFKNHELPQTLRNQKYPQVLTWIDIA